MALEIENRGKGFLGEIGAGWSFSLNGSPMTVGDQAGRLGTLNFTAGCDSTSKFTIDNYLSVKHFYDDQTTRWLSTFDGHIRSASINGKTGNFTMASILAGLDVERTSSVDCSGTYQRTMEVVRGYQYTIGASTYTLGGYWTSVGSENVFVPRPTIVYDVASSEHYVYVLVAGQHAGEVVCTFGIDGYFYGAWPVYSDATDLSNPNARYLSHADGFLYVAQVAADRVKKFNLEGTFILQWGTAGSGDGQFNTIGGIAANDSGLNAVYVTDSVLGRVQCFTETGGYLFKWGTSGTGAGATVFNQPNGVSIDPKTQNVFISDANARVRAYSSGGGYISEPFGRYDFTTGTSKGEFVKGNYYISHGFDHLGNGWAMQLGKVYKYIREGSDWVVVWGQAVKEFDAMGLDTDTEPPRMISVSHHTGLIHTIRTTDNVDQYAGSLGNVQAYILYYIALAAPNFPLRLMLMNDEYATGEANYIAWRGNVWQQLCDLCAATGNAMALFDESLYFFSREDRTIPLPDDALVSPVSLNSRAAGQSIEIVNQNSRYTDGLEVMYSAQADNNRQFTVDVHSFATISVRQDTYPEFLHQPTPSTDTGPGHYMVVDSNNLIVDPVAWRDFGGYVWAEIGEEPGTIVLTIAGPGVPIPGREGPFKIATDTREAALSVTGFGVVSQPETLTIGTGVTEDVTNRKVAQTIDSPFAHNAEVAYSEGSWAAYKAGTPEQRFTASFSTNRTVKWENVGGVGGTLTLMSGIVTHDDAQYMIETVDVTASTITLGMYRYTKLGWGNETGYATYARPEEIWGGKTAGEFDAYWTEYTAQDFTIAPLRNPYGV